MKVITTLFFLFLILINNVDAKLTKYANTTPVITINRGYISRIQVAVYDIFSSDLSFNGNDKSNLLSIINNDLKNTNLITITNRNLV